MKIADSVEARFKELFREQPLLIRSPGRVNLIGEHTDYNHGYVLPAAIDKAIYFAITPRDHRQFRVHALDLQDEHHFSLDALQFSQKGWPNYLMGVIGQFVKARHDIGGFNCVCGGDIPIGAGLSSSASGTRFSGSIAGRWNLVRIHLIFPTYRSFSSIRECPIRWPQPSTIEDGKNARKVSWWLSTGSHT